MIKVKTTVKPKNLVITAACANVAEELHISILVTSGNDSKHMEGSKHYSYEALDIRSKTMSTEVKKLFLSKVMERLGPAYRGILENKGKDNEHFHIEYDPQ